MIDWIKYKLEGVWILLNVVGMLLLVVAVMGVVLGIIFGVPAAIFVWVVESISNLFR